MKSADPHTAGDPTPPVPAAVPGDLSDYFRENARSFSYAALLFPGRERRRVARLYAYCRITDDLVDHGTTLSDDVLSARLEAWMRRSRDAYEGRSSGIHWMDELMERSADAGVPFSLIADLGKGVRMDIGPVALQSLKELRLYSSRVASVVGIWLCHLWGVREPRLLERAAALGQAMQLTNILRDVGEDLRHNRCYLPADLMEKHGLRRADLRHMLNGQAPSPAYRALIAELMRLAESDYERAWEGIVELPPHLRRAIAVAAEVYRGIHHDLQRKGYDNFRYRAHTKLAGKVRLSVRAGRRLHRQADNSACTRCLLSGILEYEK